MEKPIEHGALKHRQSMPAVGQAPTSQVQVADISIGRGETRIVTHDGRMRVVAEVGGDGIDQRRRHDPIKLTRLNRETLKEHLQVEHLDGHRPAGLPTHFVPTRAKPAHALDPRSTKGRDQGGTIFDTDDRYLFHDTGFPWRTTGKARRAGAWGSATTIGPRHVLTASHVVNWNADGNGNPGWITFTPSYFDGSGPWGEIAATEVIFWEQAPGSLTDQQTAFDYVVLVMEERIGDIIGYPGYRTYDGSWNGGAYWQYIGYPGERSSGERPAFQGSAIVSSVQNFSLSGQTGYVLGHFNEFTPGQSGGASWGWWGDEPWPRVIGIGSTIGSTAVQSPSGSTVGDNEYGGGPGLSALISWARANRP
jgi:V8-like Glu-specific endopeptidase